MHAIGAAALIDRHEEPDVDATFRLPHEARAGEALGWLSHMQAHDNDRHGLWSRWAVMSRDEKRAWLARRREILHGLIRAAHAYRRARSVVGLASELNAMLQRGAEGGAA